MSPLTRPGVGQSLNNQPAVMDEYADAIEAIKELPAGIARTQDFTVLAAIELDGANGSDADITTGWSQANTQDGTVVLDTTIKTEGTGSVNSRPRFDLAGSRVSFAPSSAISKGNYHHIAVWIRWQAQIGAQDPADSFKIRVSSDSTTLGGTYVEVPFPRILQDTWRRVVIPLGSLTQVRSVGVIQPTAAAGAAVGDRFYVWQDFIQFKELNELERALLSATTTGALVSPQFVTAGTPEQLTPEATKSVVELRSGKQYVTGLGGVRDIREYGLAEDGSVDLSNDLMNIINALPDGTTLRLTAGAKYLVNDQIRITNKNDITIDGQGARLFTIRRRGHSLTYGNVGDAFIQLQSCSNVTIRNLECFGFREATYTGMQLTVDQGPTEAHASDANVRVLNAQNEMASIPGNISAPNYRVWYSRSVDGKWRWEITLSQSGTVTEDAEIAVDLVELVGAAFPMTVVGNFHKQTVTLPQYPATQTYVIEGRPTAAQLRLRARVSVRKKKPDVNDVNIHSMLERGRCEYDGGWDNGPGILIGRGSNYVVEDCHFEGMGTDAVQCIGGGDANGSFLNGVTVRRCVAVANNRHGYDFDWGEDALFEDLWSIGCGYHGMDIEPYDLIANPPTAYGWYVKRLTLRNIHFDGAFFVAIGAANWAGIENLTVENIRYGRCHQGFMFGGARKFLVANVQSDGGYTDQENNTFYGTDVAINNCVLGGILRLVGGNNMDYRPNGSGTTTTATSQDMIATGCMIIPPFYGNDVNNARYMSGLRTRMIGVMVDGVASPAGVSQITPPASGSPYQNTSYVPEVVYIRNGTGTISDVKKDTRTIFTSAPCTVYLEHGESVTPTYAGGTILMERDRK